VTTAAVGVASVAPPLTPLRTIPKVRLPLTILSSVIGIWMSFVVSPGPNVAVPLVG
jgi:hypothetical protein